MLNFQYMSLRSRLLISSFILLFLAAILGATGFYFVWQVRNTTLILTDVASPLVESVNKLNSQVRKTQYVLTNSLEEWSESNRMIVNKSLNTLQQVIKEEVRKIDNLSTQLNLHFPTQKIIDVQDVFSKQADLILSIHIADAHEKKLNRHLKYQLRDLRPKIDKIDKVLSNISLLIEDKISKINKKDLQAYAPLYNANKATYEARNNAFSFLNIVNLYTSSINPNATDFLSLYFERKHKETLSHIHQLSAASNIDLFKKLTAQVVEELMQIAHLVRGEKGIFDTYNGLLQARKAMQKINLSLAAINDEYEKNLNSLYTIATNITSASKRKIKHSVEESLGTILIVITISVAFFFLLTLLISRSISKPLEQITGTMHRLAEGDLNVDIQYTDQENEIGKLAKAALAFHENVSERERLEHIQAEQTEKIICYAQEAARAREMKVALDKERELNNLQKQFISMASHEFRTPLAIIDVSVQKLLRNSRKDRLDEEMVQGISSKIRGGVQRMTRLMESTLMTAKIEAGKLNIEIGECDINTLLKETCSIQSDVSSKHEIIVKSENMPAFIKADTGAITQVITNLLSNAIKYSPEEDKIEVHAYRKGEDIFISVRDFGLGIDEDDLNNIGNRFFRAKTSTGIVGTGIGLNLVKKLIDEHEGELTIQSIKGEGSTFTIRLPIQGPEESNKKRQDEQDNQGDTDNTGHPEMFVA